MHSALEQSKAWHGIVFLTALGAVAIVLSPLTWPWYVLLPLLVYAVVVLAWPALRRTAPRFAFGRWTGWPLVAAVGLSVATSAALVVFQTFGHPEVADLAAGVPVAVFGNLLFAGICFSAANATLEELIFRGILWEVAAVEWNVGVALGATTALFWPGPSPWLSARSARRGVGGHLWIGVGAASVVDRRTRVGDCSSRMRRCHDLRLAVLVRSIRSSNWVTAVGPPATLVFQTPTGVTLLLPRVRTRGRDWCFWA
jgi:membrane protease YdiL (CAAX protease family)